MTGIRLGVDPAPPKLGSAWTKASKKALDDDVTAFKAAFAAGDFLAAAGWAGGIAVALEKRDDSRALDWWLRERWLRARVEAGWDGSCDRPGCTERATMVVFPPWDAQSVSTYCDRHAADEAELTAPEASA